MTSKVDTDQIGTVRHYKDGVLHREDGPAVVWPDGYQEWWLSGRRHRADGPARSWPDSYQEWWLSGRRHRADGPAVIWADGSLDWWLNDDEYTFDNWCEKANITDQQKTFLMLKYNVHTGVSHDY